VTPSANQAHGRRTFGEGRIVETENGVVISGNREFMRNVENGLLSYLGVLSPVTSSTTVPRASDNAQTPGLFDGVGEALNHGVENIQNAAQVKFSAGRGWKVEAYAANARFTAVNVSANIYVQGQRTNDLEYGVEVKAEFLTIALARNASSRENGSFTLLQTGGFAHVNPATGEIDGDSALKFLEPPKLVNTMNPGPDDVGMAVQWGVVGVEAKFNYRTLFDLN